jgi:hypothetical protein
MPPLAMNRRRFVKTALAATLVLGGSTIALVRTRGYAVPAGRTLAGFTAWQFVVVQHAARRIAAPDRAGVPSSDDVDVAGFADDWVSRMPAAVRRDLGRFLAYLEHLAPVGCGLASRFTRLTPSEQDRVLSATEASSNDLLRAGFEGLKSLVFLGFYRDARTWSILGYDGPLVARPEGGWR